MPSIFISHASVDKPLVDGLFDLLQTGCSLRHEEIKCTSVDGAGIETGEEFIAWIKAGLQISDLIILVITPNYFASKFCMAEMGAVWALNRRVFPVVIPDIPREVGIVMLGRQTAQINDTGLDELRDDIVKLFPDVGKSTPRWNAKKQVFLADLVKILESLPEPNLIDRRALRTEQEKSEAFVQIIQELEMQNGRFREQITALEGLKDRDAVQELKLKSLPQIEQYETLLENVQKEVESFSPIELRCLYALLVNSPWYPGRDFAFWNEWGGEVNKALNSHWINERHGENVYMANERHPRYKSALIAIEKFGEFIHNMDRDLKDTIQDKEKYIIDIGNLEYWSSAIYGRQLLE